MTYGGDIMTRNVLIISVLITLLNSCATYLGGDYRYGKLSEDLPPLNVTKIVEQTEEGENTTSYSYWVEKIQEDYPNLDKEHTYQIYLTPRNDSEYTNWAFTATMFTLGLVPLYTQERFSVEVSIRRDEEEEVFSTTLKGRLHIFYGWLPAIISQFFPENNPVSIDEGSGIQGAVNRIMRYKTLYALTKILQEEPWTE